MGQSVNARCPVRLDYSDEEIRGWVPTLCEPMKDKEVYVHYNNHYRAKAAKNAAMLQQLLDSALAAPSSWPWLYDHWRGDSFDARH